MNTQDGYDWPTPHAVAPPHFWWPPAQPVEAVRVPKCITCGDTRVLRMPTFPPSFKACPGCNA